MNPRVFRRYSGLLHATTATTILGETTSTGFKIGYFYVHNLKYFESVQQYQELPSEDVEVWETGTIVDVSDGTVADETMGLSGTKATKIR